eukprot:c4128_g1_i2.p1 GENE.c4128_g1_i2~~c4128_g1_i2.p1  ORF type:complete len:155 (+),score=26.87 c4128_g1_i2:387-851(+)
MLGDRRSDFVGNFLHSVLGPSLIRPHMYHVKEKLCVNDLHVCEDSNLESKPLSKCNRCRAIARDIWLVVNRLKPTSSSLDRSAAVGGVCGELNMRHNPNTIPSLTATCDEFFDEHDDQIIKTSLAYYKEEAALVNALCNQISSHCNKRISEKEL